MLLLVSLVLGLNYYATYSVLINFYLIFALALVLFGEHQPEWRRSFLLGGMATGWLLSFVSKLNASSWAGFEISYHLRLIARSYAKSAMENPFLSRLSARAGMISELLSFLTFFAGSWLASVGFAALIAFTTGIMLNINGGHAVLRFFLGLSFLLGFRWARGKCFLLFVLWPVIAQLLLRIVGLAQQELLLRPLFILYGALVRLGHAFFVLASICPNGRAQRSRLSRPIRSGGVGYTILCFGEGLFATHARGLDSIFEHASRLARARRFYSRPGRKGGRRLFWLFYFLGLPRFDFRSFVDRIRFDSRLHGHQCSNVPLAKRICRSSLTLKLKCAGETSWRFRLIRQSSRLCNSKRSKTHVR